MSESLKARLHEQATSVALRPPDFEAVRRLGDRRVRVRRALSALAGAATVALIISIVVVGRPDPAPPVSPWPSNSVSWATGSTIHVGTETVEVGHKVWTYVRTGAGFAVVDDSYDVYSVTGHGVERIGHMTAPPPIDSDAAWQARLATDPQGTLVGWVGEDSPGKLTLQTYDQATRRHRSYPLAPGWSSKDVVFAAIDGRTGYWRTPAGVYAVDLDTGEKHTLLEPVGPNSPSRFGGIYSVENGVLAFRLNEAEGDVDVFYAGRSIVGAKELLRQSDQYLIHATPGRLSPTGAWFSVSQYRLEKVAEGHFNATTTTADVYNTTTGEHVTLDVSLAGPADQTFASPVVWLDDVTVQVLAATADATRPDGRRVNAALYTCTVPGGSCRLAVDLGAIDTTSPNGPVMPEGRGSAAP